MKIAILADTHHGVRGDTPVFHDYFSKFYHGVFYPYLKNNDIKTIIHLGDIVDRPKSIDYLTLSHLKYEMNIMMTEFDSFFIAGNHDTYYKKSNDLFAIAELFPQSQYFVNPTEIELGDEKILLIPWITPENKDETLRMIDRSRARYAMGHLEISGFQMYRGIVRGGGMDPNIFSKFDTVLSGHYHHKSNQGPITYVGAPYEMTWHDFNDWRGFHVFDTVTGKLEAIRNPHRMFFKIVYDEKRDMKGLDTKAFQNAIVRVVIREATNKSALESFCERIEDVAFSFAVVDQRVDMNLSIIPTANTADTSSIIKSAVKGLDASEDLKTKVEAKIQSLWIDAQNLDV